MVAISATVGATVIGSGAAAEATSGTTYYVNCASGSDSAHGTSPAKAWKSLNRVNKVTYKPGDSVLFARGTTCQGVLQPKGSGTAAAPITLGAYGTGDRPKIVAPGARAAIFLRNVQGYEIRALDVSNPGPADGTARVGIYVQLVDFGIGRHYLVHNTVVHDIPGCDCLDPALENSGGILFEAGGSTKPTGFDGITVTKNSVSGTDNVGIGTLSLWSKRSPLYPAGLNSYVPITNVRIAHNTVSDQGGDGILVMNGASPVVERNLVSGFGLRASQSHGGILAFNSDDARIQLNEVTGGAASPPSFALSVDAATSGLIVQRNYSHDNHGPFLLMCAPTGSTVSGATVRYNISNNDHDIAAFGIPVVAGGCFGSTEPITDTAFYNNVIYSPEASFVVGALPNVPVTFTNNIFSGQSAGAQIFDQNGIYDSNFYQNMVPPAGDLHAQTGDPQFTAPGTGPDGFTLACGSAAVGTGAVIAHNGNRDFYGTPTPSDQIPNIGAYEGPCL